MIQKDDVINSIKGLYEGINGFNIKKNGAILEIKPDNAKTGYEIPELKGILSCKFYDLDNIEELLEEKEGYIKHNYWNWHPIARLKNTILQSKGVMLDSKSLVIAPYCFIGAPGYYKDTILDSLRKIVIGKQTFFGGGAKVMTHYYNPEDNSLEVGHLKIGNNCLIGAYSEISPGTVIGDNSIIGVREKVKGIIKPDSVVSNKIYKHDKLPESLSNSRWRLYRITKQVAKRLRKNLYKNRDVFISKSAGSERLYISPDKPLKKDYCEYSKESLQDIIMSEEPVLSCMFTDFGSSVKRSVAPQSVGKLLWTKVTGSLIGKVLTNGDFKNSLYRLVGFKIGKGTRIGTNPYIEYVNPDLSTIGRSVKIGDNVIMANHYYIEGKINGFMTGIMHISDNAVIPDGCILLPGTYVGKGVNLEKELTFQGIFL
ncbi:hypothetical protein COS83_04915 [archaeon CG07_land_8_20_14_0_80_38_8]|nr:MAG: hypothetical protein COS83_04915 [archaeon CG07_land_8_20_14_0_80_38_8]PIU88650.1 MAG: hypothetical protein COS64_03385 [archaeon CG06_land_8_20_14_3_00_37_11]